MARLKNGYLYIAGELIMKHLITLSFLIFLTANAASKADTYTVASYAWEPFIDTTRKDGGISIDIIRKGLESQGHSIEVVNIPWVRALSMLKKNKIDILPAVWHTQERTQFMQYSDHYAKNRLVFIKTKEDDYEFEGLESLHGRVVGIARDYAYGEDFLNDKNIEFSVANNLQSNVKKVIAGRVELTIEDEIVAKSVIPRYLLRQLTFTQNALSENALYLTCNKSNPKCSTIVEAFNLGLKQMQTDGSLDAIINDLENIDD